MAMARTSVLIWRGFEHKWGYNHRFNRFGSYIEHDSGDEEATIDHTGSSGWGPDVAQVTDYFTRVEDADGVWFLTGVTEPHIDLEITRMQAYSKPHPVTVDLPAEMQGLPRERYAVLLNGFDLQATKEGFVDKLINFSLGVGEVEVQDATLSFDVRVEALTDCRSLECWADLWARAEKDSDLKRQIQGQIDRVQVEALFATRGASLPEVTRGEEDLIGMLELLPPDEAEEPAGGWERELDSMIAELEKREEAAAAEVVRGKGFSDWRDLLDDLLQLRRETNHGKELAKLVKKSLGGEQLALPPSEYKLRVHFVVVAGREDALHVHQAPGLVQRDVYATLEEPAADPDERIPHAFAAASDHGLESVPGVGALAFTTKMLGSNDEDQLDCEAMHYMQWQVVLEPPRSNGGDAEMDLRLFFSTWDDGMTTSNDAWNGEATEAAAFAAKRAPQHAHKFAGHARVGVKPVLLQVRAAKVRPDSSSARIVWGGVIDKNNQKNDSPRPTPVKS